MTQLVVDSSVVVKWFVIESYSAQAELILNDYQVEKYTFLAPDFLNAEVGNILWKKQAFRGFDPTDALRIVKAFRKLTFTQVPTADLLEDAYNLAVKYQRSVYDMLYVALSVREGCSFVTADEKLVNAISPAISSVIWLGNWK